MTKEEKSFEHIHKNVQSILFRFKDLQHSCSRIDLLAQTINLTTKIYCRNKTTSENFTFLVAPSYFDQTVLMNIVASVLFANNFDIEPNSKFDHEIIAVYCSFLEESNNIKVCLENNIISLRCCEKYIELLNLQNTEKIARQIILRSLCILFAMSGKNVSNNVDGLILNDYGVMRIIP